MLNGSRETAHTSAPWAFHELLITRELWDSQLAAEGVDDEEDNEGDEENNPKGISE